MASEENKTIITPKTPGELALMYSVTLKTLRSWLAPHREKIGVRTARTFTTRQIESIFTCLGPPSKEFRDSPWSE